MIGTTHLSIKDKQFKNFKISIVLCISVIPSTTTTTIAVLQLKNR